MGGRIGAKEWGAAEVCKREEPQGAFWAAPEGEKSQSSVSDFIFLGRKIIIQVEVFIVVIRVNIIV